MYPGGSLAANVIGSATWDATDTPGKLTGRIGLESSQDNLLSGSNGVREVDTAEGSNAEIPGSVRYERPAVPGSTLQLTLDSDLQYTVQRDLSAFIAKTRAKPDSSVVVLDVATGEGQGAGDRRDLRPHQPRRGHDRPARRPRRHLALRARLGQQDRDDVGGDRVRRHQARRRARRARQHQGRRPHDQRRLEARPGALHAHRRAREVVQRRHDHDGAEGRARSGSTTCCSATGWACAPASGCPARARATCRRWRAGRAPRSATCRSARASP